MKTFTSILFLFMTLICLDVAAEGEHRPGRVDVTYRSGWYDVSADMSAAYNPQESGIFTVYKLNDVITFSARDTDSSTEYRCEANPSNVYYEFAEHVLYNFRNGSNIKFSVLPWSNYCYNLKYTFSTALLDVSSTHEYSTSPTTPSGNVVNGQIMYAPMNMRWNDANPKTNSELLFEGQMSPSGPIYFSSRSSNGSSDSCSVQTSDSEYAFAKKALFALSDGARFETRFKGIGNCANIKIWKTSSAFGTRH